MNCGCATNNAGAATCTPATKTQTQTPARARDVFLPAVDVIESEDMVMLIADLPGVRAEDLEIRQEDGTLSIAGKVALRRGESAKGVLMSEYGVGDFARSFKLGDGIDAENIGAELKLGVLTLRLPKTEAVKPRRIAVKIG